MASISYREDRKKWQVSYVTPDGQQKRKLYRTKKEAEAYRDGVTVLRHTGELQTFSDTTEIHFADFVPEYMEYAKAFKARNTWTVEEALIKAQYIPFFGRLQMSAILPRHMEHFKVKRQKDGVSARAINLDITILSVMFKYAIKLGYARKNPLDDVDRLKEAKKPPRFLSEDEIQRLLSSAQDTYLFPLILCGLHAGLRKSELFHLKWSDLNFERNTITIQPDAERRTKDNDFRELEMTDALRSELQRLYANRLNDEYVFTYAGKPLHSNVTRTWKRLMREAGIENCTLHTLRHSFASHLAMQGVPLTHIQRLMGHDDHDTTLIYAHLSKESLRGQVSKLPFSSNKDA